MRTCRVCSDPVGDPEPVKGQNICRPCYRIQHNAWRAKRPEGRNAEYQKNRQANIDRAVEWNRSNKERRLVITRTWRWRLRLEMIKAYGGKCACCEENQPEFLSIDHVNNDGYAKRIKGEPSGAALYRQLRDKGWPQDDYQLLCMNCNFAKGHFGECPHKADRDFSIPMWGKENMDLETTDTSRMDGKTHD